MLDNRNHLIGALGAELQQLSGQSSDGTVHEVDAIGQPVQLDVPPADLEVLRVGLHRERPATGHRKAEPHRVVRPEAAEFDDGRVDDLQLREPGQDRIEDQLFLGLVVTGETANDLGHPRPVVTALVDQQTVMHHLHRAIAVHRDYAGVVYLGNPVGIAARHCHQDATSHLLIEAADIQDEICWPHSQPPWFRLQRPIMSRLTSLDRTSGLPSTAAMFADPRAWAPPGARHRNPWSAPPRRAAPGRRGFTRMSTPTYCWSTRPRSRRRTFQGLPA